MSLTLGEKLRQAREERGISISEVAEQTRISPHYLESIENDDYRTLPGGIFNKGFVKSYAKYVGLDEVEALQDYTQIIVSQNGEATDEPKTYRPEVLTDDRASSSILPTIVFAVIILGLMTWGILSLVSYIQNNPSALSSTNTNQAIANANVATASVNAASVNPTPSLPATNEIKVEFKPTAEVVNVTATVDGKTTTENVTAAAPKTYVGQQNVRVKYYRGFADKVQITVNDKQIAPPPAPARGNIIDFEINKNNIVQVLQSGQIAAESDGATAPPR